MRERLRPTNHLEEIVTAPREPVVCGRPWVTGKLHDGEPGSLVGVQEKESEMTPSELTNPHCSPCQLHLASTHGRG